MSTPVPPTDQAAPGVEVVLLTTDLEFRDVVLAAAGEQRPVFPVLTLSEALQAPPEQSTAPSVTSGLEPSEAVTETLPTPSSYDQVMV